MKTLFILLALTSTAFSFEMHLDVSDSSGQLQSVKVDAETIVQSKFSPSMYMPFVVFPNGDYALIDSKSDLDEVICEKLKGEYVFNPYRDLRMSFTQLLNYRRGLFSGTYSVRGNKTDGYYEAEISGSDMAIMALGCSTY